MNSDSEEDDDSDEAEEEGDDDEDEDEDDDGAEELTSEKDVDMDGPTRDELEQTAEGQYNLSGEEDSETGILKFLNENFSIQSDLCLSIESTFAHYHYISGKDFF